MIYTIVLHALAFIGLAAVTLIAATAVIAPAIDGAHKRHHDET